MMRIDKYLTEAGLCSRSEATRACRAGQVKLGGTPVRDPSVHIDPETAAVTFRGEEVVWRRFTYIMLNKPEGYLSVTDDPKQKTVLDLLDERTRRLGLFPCGRLDRSTVGLLILTNNGAAAHALLSPRHHAEKEYRFTVKFPLSDADIAALEAGIDLEADSVSEAFHTAPCTIRRTDDRSGTIVLTEGKYHQIKRMMEAVHNQITSLERISFASIALDPALGRGEWRHLTAEEQAIFEKQF